MKKILLLITFLFILTGCTINYELKINKDDINEMITGTVTKEESDIDPEETSLNLFYTLVNFEQSALFNADSFYDKKITEKDNYLEYNANYTYINNFKDSNIINTCFEKHEINETDDFYDIHLSGNFYCLFSKKININITSNMAVLENNADSVNKNTYSWVIDDSKDVDILLTASKNIEAFNAKEESVFSVYKIITFILLIILIIASLIIYKKRNSEN